jgi:hypothetical protein
MLDVVPPEQDELALPVEVVDVHNPEPRLTRAPPVLSREHQASSREPPQHEGEQGQQREDDDEGDQILDRRRISEPELRQHDELSTVVEPRRGPKAACQVLYHWTCRQGQRG